MGLISRVSSRTYRFKMSSVQHVAGKNASTGAKKDPLDEIVDQKEWERIYKAANVHMNLLAGIKPSMLKFTQHDDEIYKEFRKEFPEFDVKMIDPDTWKTDEQKKKWESFTNHFENLVADLKQSTLLRLTVFGGYNENNTTLAPRIEFLAIEIARNREKDNDKLHDMIQEQKRSQPKGGCCSRC